MKNTQNNLQNLAQNAERKVLYLSSVESDTAQNPSFAAIIRRNGETADVSITDETNRVQPLIGDSDPHSTPFGVKHFWHNTSGF